MAFARWSTACADGRTSDLYVFHHVGGWLTCFACPMVEDDDPDSYVDDVPCWNTRDSAAMADHVRQHVAAGDAVPDGLVERIEDYDWHPRNA